MTTSKRSVDFREQPEIIGESEISIDENTKRDEDHVHKSIVEVHLNGDLTDNSEDRKDYDKSNQTGKTFVSELFIDVFNHQEKDTKVLIEPLGEQTKRKIYVKSHENLKKNDATLIEDTQYHTIYNNLDHSTSVNANNNHEIPKVSERQPATEMFPIASKSNEMFSMGHKSKEIVIKKDFPTTETKSSLSYSSFPGHDNFILVEANDWLKQGSKFDKDGFALQSNFGHFDVKSKPSSRPWLSQFRKTEQRMYMKSNGKVVQDISVQDHDGKAYITSYHTNKEMKSLKPPLQSRGNTSGQENLENNHHRDKNFSQVSCLFYMLILLGALLVIGVTLLVVYTT